MDFSAFISNLTIVLIGFGAIAWVVKKLGGDNQTPQQSQNSVQLEEIHGESYREFFDKVVKPMMDANADLLSLDYPRGFPQHMPEQGNRVGLYHGKLTFCYVFQRKYHMLGGITEEGGVKEPRKAYIPFSTVEMKKELASHLQSYCVVGGMPVCKDVLISDRKDGKILIGFCFEN